MATLATLGFSILSRYDGSGVRAANRDINDLQNNLNSGSTGLSNYTKRLMALTAAALTVGPALIPIGAGALAVGGGLVSATASAGAAAGIFGGALIGSIKELTGTGGLVALHQKLDEQKAKLAGLTPGTKEYAAQLKVVKAAQEQYTAALKDASPAQKNFAAASSEMSAKYKDFLKQTESSTLPAATVVLRSFGDGLLKLVPVVKAVAPVAMEVAKAFEHWVDTKLDDWVKFIVANGIPVLRNFITIAKNLGKTVGLMIKAFAPLGEQVTKQLAILSAKLAGWAEGGGFERFLKYVSDNGPALKEFFKAAGGALLVMAKALKDMAPLALTGVTLFFKVIAGMNPEDVKNLAYAYIALKLALSAWPALSAIASGISAIGAAAAAAGVGFWALMGPIALVVAVVVALGVVIYLMVTRWNEFATYISSSFMDAVNITWNFLKQLWSWISGFFATVWGGVRAAWDATWQAISIAVRAVWTALQIAWNAFVGALATAWTTVSTALQTAWNAVWNAMSVAVRAVWTALQVAWNAFTSALATAWTAVSTALQTAWNAVWNAMSVAVRAIWTALQAAWSAFIGALQTVWNTVSGALSAAWSAFWGALSTAARAVWSALQAAWSAFMGALTTAWNAFKGAMQTAWNALWAALTTAWNTFKGAIQAAWSAFWAALTTAWNTFKSAIQAAWSAFWAALTTAWNTFKAAIQAAWSAFWAALTTAWNTFKAAIQAAWSALWAALTAAWNTFKAAMQAAWSALWAALTAAWNAFKAAFSAAWQAAWNAVKAAAQAVWTAMKAAWQAFVNGIKTIWDTFSGPFKTAVKAVWDAVLSTAKTVWNSIGGVIEKAINGVIGIINKLGDGFNAVAKFLHIDISVGDIKPVNFPGLADGGMVMFKYGGMSGGPANMTKGGALSGYQPGRDSTPAMLSRGEGVLVPEAVRGLGGPSFVHSANRTFAGHRGAGKGPRFPRDSMAKGNLNQSEFAQHPFAKGGMAGGGMMSGGMQVPGFAMGGITLAALARAGLAGVSITQPEFNTGVAASAGTHDGGGVVDLPANPATLQALLATGEWAAWMRGPEEGMSPHIHAVLMSHPQLSAAARAQVASFKAGGNGLGVGGGGGGGGIPSWLQAILAKSGEILANVAQGKSIGGILGNLGLGDDDDENGGGILGTGIGPDVGPDLTPGEDLGSAVGGILNTITGGAISKLEDLGKMMMGLIPDGAFKTAFEFIADKIPGIGGIGGEFAKITGKMAEMSLKGAIDLLTNKNQEASAAAMAQFAGSGIMGDPASVQKWAALAAKALALAGLAPDQLNAFLALMAAESGGNPNAVNRTDSNAIAGTPSQGLMQVIPGTFAAYHVAGTSNDILDPLANMAASAAYIKAKYGGNVPGSPYAAGTNSATPGMHLVGEKGPELAGFAGGETVIPAGPTKEILGGGGKGGAAAPAGMSAPAAAPVAAPAASGVPDMDAAMAAAQQMQSTFQTVWAAIVANTASSWSAINMGTLTPMRSTLGTTVPMQLSTMQGANNVSWSTMTADATTQWTAQEAAIYTPLTEKFTVTVPAQATAMQAAHNTSWTAMTTDALAQWTAQEAQVFTPLMEKYTVTVPTQATAMHTANTLHWTGMSLDALTQWTAQNTQVYTPLGTMYTVTVPTQATAMKTAHQTQWTGMTTDATSQWSAQNTGVYTPMNTMMGTTVPASASQMNTQVSASWASMDTATTQHWTSMTGTVKTSVGNMVTPINGLIGGFNNVASALGVGTTVPEISVPGLAGGGVINMRKGGAVSGYQPGKDTVPAVLSRGEGVLVPEAVRGLGGPGFIHAANAYYRKGRSHSRGGAKGMPQGFANGGIAGGGLPGFCEGGLCPTKPNKKNQTAGLGFANGGMADGFGMGPDMGGIMGNDNLLRFLTGTITAQDAAGLACAGIPLSAVTQGSFSTGVAASAGTHAGDGVVDLVDTPGYVEALRACGWAAWERTPEQGFAYHIHAVLMGASGLSPEAAGQVLDFLAGGDGLGVGAVDPSVLAGLGLGLGGIDAGKILKDIVAGDSSAVPAGMGQFVLGMLTPEMITDAFADIKSALDSADVGDGIMGQGFHAMGTKLYEGVIAKITAAAAEAKAAMQAALAAAGAAGGGGAGVQQWSALASQALSIAGLDQSQLPAFLALMQAESSGDPNAINNTDINAQNGTPSKGLMQVIQPTFDAYCEPGYCANIMDPLSNMIASANYIQAVYGGQVPGSPYQMGTSSAKPGWHIVGENGPEMWYARGGERMLSNKHSKREFGEITGQGQGGTGDTVHFNDGCFQFNFHGGVTSDALNRIEQDLVPKLRMAVQSGVGKLRG